MPRSGNNGTVVRLWAGIMPCLACNRPYDQAQIPTHAVAIEHLDDTALSPGAWRLLHRKRSADGTAVRG